MKRSFIKKKCKEWKIDKYDLTDPAIRRKLIDIGFTLRVNKDI